MKLPPKVWAITILLLMAAIPPWRRDGQWLRESTGQSASTLRDFELDRWYFGFQPYYRPLWSASNRNPTQGPRIEWPHAQDVSLAVAEMEHRLASARPAGASAGVAAQAGCTILLLRIVL